MSEKRFSHRRYSVVIETSDQRAKPLLLVDGESVPLDLIDGKFGVTYFPLVDDLEVAAKAYVDRLATKGKE